MELRVGRGLENTFVVQLSGVARGGVIRDAALHGRADGLRHRTVLEVRLAEELQVVDDDLGAGVAETAHRLVESERAGDAAREEERRTGREVVHDPEDGRALGAAPGAASRRHRHGGEIARGLGGRQRIETVRDHADGHAGAVDAERADLIRARRGISGAGDRADAGVAALDRPHRRHRVEAGDRPDAGGRHPALDEPVRHVLTLDGQPRPPERRPGGVVEHLDAHLHVHPALPPPRGTPPGSWPQSAVGGEPTEGPEAAVEPLVGRVEPRLVLLELAQPFTEGLRAQVDRVCVRGEQRGKEDEGNEPHGRFRIPYPKSLRLTATRPSGVPCAHEDAPHRDRRRRALHRAVASARIQHHHTRAAGRTGSCHRRGGRRPRRCG